MSVEASSPSPQPGTGRTSADPRRRSLRRRLLLSAVIVLGVALGSAAAPSAAALHAGGPSHTSNGHHLDGTPSCC